MRRRAPSARLFSRRLPSTPITLGPHHAGVAAARLRGAFSVVRTRVGRIGRHRGASGVVGVVFAGVGVTFEAADGFHCGSWSFERSKTTHSVLAHTAARPDWARNLGLQLHGAPDCLARKSVHARKWEDASVNPLISATEYGRLFCVS